MGGEKDKLREELLNKINQDLMIGKFSAYSGCKDAKIRRATVQKVCSEE